MRLPPELTPVFVRAHTRVKRERPRREREATHPTTWANFAVVYVAMRVGRMVSTGMPPTVRERLVQDCAEAKPR